MAHLCFLHITFCKLKVTFFFWTLSSGTFEWMKLAKRSAEKPVSNVHCDSLLTLGICSRASPRLNVSYRHRRYSLPSNLMDLWCRIVDFYSVYLPCEMDENDLVRLNTTHESRIRWHGIKTCSVCGKKSEFSISFESFDWSKLPSSFRFLFSTLVC